MRSATQLMKSGDYNDAIYLAGYALECAFKVRIADLLDEPLLFSDENAEKNRLTEENDLKLNRDYVKPYKIHDLYKLLFQAGLRNTFNKQKLNNQKLQDSWTYVTSTINWTEQIRYSEKEYLLSQTEQFIESVMYLVEWTNKNLRT